MIYSENQVETSDISHPVLIHSASERFEVGVHIGRYRLLADGRDLILAIQNAMNVWPDADKETIAGSEKAVALDKEIDDVGEIKE